MYDLEQAIADRRSIRMFQSDRPVPRDLVDEALELAVRAPSNSNIQPWHLALVSGDALQRLVAALMHEARAKPPVVPQLPPSACNATWTTSTASASACSCRRSSCR